MEQVAYVICCNDLIKCVALDRTFAEKLKAELSFKHYESARGMYKDYDEYERICYWHIHETYIKE